jgi:hypothetical protein
MKGLSIKQLVVFMLVFTVGISVCEAQTSPDRAPKPAGKGFFGLFSGKKSTGKPKAPKNASQVKKEQEKKKKKSDADYAKSIKESQKRTIKIQTPDVQDRMKQNKRDITAREKARKKKTSSATRKAGSKYKK